MSEMAKDLIRIGYKCSHTRAADVDAKLWQDVVNVLFHAANWVGVCEMTIRQEQNTIGELRRHLGDTNGRIAPRKGSPYSGPLAKTLPMEKTPEEA